LSTHPKVVAFDGLWAASPGGADKRLIETLAGGGVVAGLEGAVGGVPADYEGALTPTLTPGGGDLSTDLPAYRSAAGSTGAVDEALSGRGMISMRPDEDEVYRRYALLANVNGRIAPSLALEMYRLAAGAQFITLIQRKHRLAGVTIGATTIPVDSDSGFRVDYVPRDYVKFCSAEAIVPGKGCRLLDSGQIEPLEGKFVLIGLTDPMMEDQSRRTPMAGLQGAMPGVEIHAQALENLVSGKLVRRLPWFEVVEPLLTLAVGLFLILALPTASLILRALAAVAVALLLAGGAGLLWHEQRMLMDVATPAISCSVAMVAMLGGGLVEADAQRRRLREQLHLERIAAARAEGEMQAGRIIQLGILPKPNGLDADPRFDLDALMVAARQIGGDLFDFFKIDPDHLFIAVGDVSGKGLPASLFMALGKALCKSCALRGERDIGAIIRTANAEISRDNPEMLFITMFAGILDLNTGELRFCNAGHDAPFVLRPGEAPSALESIGGPPLCVADDFPYETEVWKLSPGDLLCITTDGVTEAMNGSGELIGRERIERVMGQSASDASAGRVMSDVQATVTRFVAGAEPSDDLTILSLRWLGPTLP
jgi:serine phosphatase RsbU (regulator of sigma subunit)